jgi:hypothetical protein
MDLDEDVLVAIGWWYLQQKKRRPRHWYVRPLYLERPALSQANVLIRRIRDLDDVEKHFEYFRMDRARFDDLLARVTPFITHRPTHDIPVGPFERLCVTLR